MTRPSGSWRGELGGAAGPDVDAGRGAIADRADVARKLGLTQARVNAPSQSYGHARTKIKPRFILVLAQT